MLMMVSFRKSGKRSRELAYQQPGHVLQFNEFLNVQDRLGYFVDPEGGGVSDTPEDIANVLYAHRDLGNGEGLNKLLVYEVFILRPEILEAYCVICAADLLDPADDLRMKHHGYDFGYFLHAAFIGVVPSEITAEAMTKAYAKNRPCLTFNQLDCLGQLACSPDAVGVDMLQFGELYDQRVDARVEEEGGDAEREDYAVDTRVECGVFGALDTEGHICFVAPPPQPDQPTLAGVVKTNMKSASKRGSKILRKSFGRGRKADVPDAPSEELVARFDRVRGEKDVFREERNDARVENEELTGKIEVLTARVADLEAAAKVSARDAQNERDDEKISRENLLEKVAEANMLAHRAEAKLHRIISEYPILKRTVAFRGDDDEEKGGDASGRPSALSAAVSPSTKVKSLGSSNVQPETGTKTRSAGSKKAAGVAGMEEATASEESPKVGSEGVPKREKRRDTGGDVLVAACAATAAGAASSNKNEMTQKKSVPTSTSHTKNKSSNGTGGSTAGRRSRRTAVVSNVEAKEPVDTMSKVDKDAIRARRTNKETIRRNADFVSKTGIYRVDTPTTIAKATAGKKEEVKENNSALKSTRYTRDVANGGIAPAESKKKTHKQSALATGGGKASIRQTRSNRGNGGTGTAEVAKPRMRGRHTDLANRKVAKKEAREEPPPQVQNPNYPYDGMSGEVGVEVIGRGINLIKLSPEQRERIVNGTLAVVKRCGKMPSLKVFRQQMKDETGMRLQSVVDKSINAIHKEWRTERTREKMKQCRLQMEQEEEGGL